jgi:hypothetical protein
MVTRDGVCIGLGTTSNYSAAANLHDSQIITVPAKALQPAMSSLPVSWQRLLIVEILLLHALKSSLHRLYIELTR